MLLLRLPRLRWSMGNSYPGHCMSRQCVFNLFSESDTPGKANNGSYWSHKKLWTEMQVLGRGRLVRDSGMQTSDEMLLGSGILWRRPIVRQMHSWSLFFEITIQARFRRPFTRCGPIITRNASLLFFSLFQVTCNRWTRYNNANLWSAAFAYFR